MTLFIIRSFIFSLCDCDIDEKFKCVVNQISFLWVQKILKFRAQKRNKKWKQSLKRSHLGVTQLAQKEPF